MDENGPLMGYETWFHKGSPWALGEPPMGLHMKSPRFGPFVAIATPIRLLVQKRVWFCEGRTPRTSRRGGCSSCIVGREGLGG